MPDNQTPVPFVPPTTPGYPQPAADGQASGHQQPVGQTHPGAPQQLGQYPQPGQWPAPHGAYQQQPVRRRKGMLIGGIILTVFGGLVLLSQLSLAANGDTTASSSGPAYMAGRVVGLLVVAVAPLVGGIIMIVRSKRR